jgi:hypothetical protein
MTLRKINMSSKRPSTQTKLFQLDAMVTHYIEFLDQNYPLQLKQDALHGLTLVKSLGKGNEGEAILFGDELGKLTVVKCISIISVIKIKPAIGEFEIMKGVQLPSVPRYHKLARTTEELLLFMDYVEGPTLRQNY